MITYHPYKSNKIVTYLAVSIGALMFVMAGGCLVSGVWYGALLIAALGTLSIWMAIIPLKAIHSTIVFEQEVLRIFDCRNNEYRCVSWEKLKYATYAKNYKGHLFLVLSSGPISPKEAKRFANRCANASRICVDDTVVIYMHFSQDVSQLKALVAEKTEMKNQYR